MASLKRGQEARATAGPGRARFPAWWVVPALLALFVATQYPDVLGIPFINDDYVFLEKTRAASFPSLWSFEGLTFNWYRPWSREFHYWSLQRLFGLNETAFHVVSLALWLGVMVAYYLLARRVGGASTAAISTAGLAALSAWAVPILWVAGVQELWALLFCLLAILALARGWTAWSVACFALALLSKETAAVLPGIAFLFLRVVERRPWRAALVAIAPHAALTLMWAAVHPMLGGRVWGTTIAPMESLGRSPLPLTLVRTLGAVANLDFLPGPDSGWKFLARGLVGAAVLVSMIAWSSRAATSRPATIGASSATRAGVGAGRSDPAPIVFGIGWALLGWLPALSPTVGWHAYYTLLGAMGAWLALGAVLARAPVAAFIAIAALSLLRSAQAETPSLDWGAEWYQRRAGNFLRFMRADLLRRRPRLPERSRVYFTEVPSNVGFLTTGGPALQAWYRDTTLRAGFYSDYRRRRLEAEPGPDLFFRYDSTAGWVEIARGRENAVEARSANPRWERDHRELAALLARVEDWAGAAAEFEKLAEANPDHPDYALNAGICHETMRDFAQAGRWYAKVLAAPAAREEDREFARGFELRVQAAR